jgi:hypothetical protein
MVAERTPPVERFNPVPMVIVVGVEVEADGLPKRVVVAIEGKSASTIVLKVGAADAPEEGPAHTKLAPCVLSEKVSVPELVTGDPDTVKMDGADKPTDVT